MSHLVPIIMPYRTRPLRLPSENTQAMFAGGFSSVKQVPEVEAFAQRQLVAETQLANTITEAIVHEIAGKLRPGITESQGRQLAKDILQHYRAKGVIKQWHKPVMYFGEHTRYSIDDTPPKADLTLRPNDIVYIDIGPVVEINGHPVEGDIGRTFVVGHQPELKALQQASAQLFQKGADYWRTHQPTGEQLYRYLNQEARKAGYRFNLEEAGHLIGSFPHHYSWRNPLSRYPYVPQSGIWILEVQLRHPTLPYGAFYEAILQ